ncbi:MAG: methyltransferase [Aestuariivirgaceae bacterium]
MQSDPSFIDMRRLISGFSISMAISAVADLGIADHLADGPKTAANLARLCGADEQLLRRVLKYLASEGVFEDQSSDVFALTEKSAWLRSDVPGSMGPRAVFIGSELNWMAWGKLLQAIKTGTSGVEAAFHECIFDYLGSHPEAGSLFNRYMAQQTATSVGAIIAAYGFTGVRRIVDVGGGHGALVAGVLQTYPDLQGVLFDRPEVVANADDFLKASGVADRCKIVAGDFFENAPADADLYALKYILHDWSDADCVRILRNCQEAMVPGGRVLVIEHVIPDHSGPDFSRFLDIHMLVLTSGGRERNRKEFTELLAAAGLQLKRMVPTSIGLFALECVSAG